MGLLSTTGNPVLCPSEHRVWEYFGCAWDVLGAPLQLAARPEDKVQAG